MLCFFSPVEKASGCNFPKKRDLNRHPFAARFRTHAS
jgi:hypothetical protein